MNIHIMEKLKIVAAVVEEEGTSRLKVIRSNYTYDFRMFPKKRQIDKIKKILIQTLHGMKNLELRP